MQAWLSYQHLYERILLYDKQDRLNTLKMGAVIDGLCKGLLENVNVIHRHKKSPKALYFRTLIMAARAGIEPATK